MDSITESAFFFNDFFTSFTTGQLKAVAGVFAKNTDFFTGNKAARNKTKPKKVTNPFGIFKIIFVTFNSLYPLGISDGNIDLILQKIKNGNPILTSRFHTEILKKPVFETSDITIKSRKPFLLIGKLDTFGGFNDCGNEKSLMYIDTTTGRENNFHGKQLFCKIRSH